MFPKHAVIETGPDKTWDRLVQHCYSIEEAERLAAAYRERYPRSNFEAR